MSRGIVVVLLVLAFAGGFMGWPWQAKPPGKIAYVRDGDLWLWERGQERQVTEGGGVSGPLIAADGQFVAFRQSELLKVASLAGGVWAVAPFEGWQAAAWSPKGATLAYAAKDGLYTVAVSGQGIGQPVLIAPNGREPVWSPDGSQLAYVDARAVTIGVAPAAGGAARTVAVIPPRGEWGRCTSGGGANMVGRSADGRWLSLRVQPLGASLSADCTTLAVVPVAGGSLIPVGEGPSNPNWQAWSPAGATLAFTDGIGRTAAHDKTVRVAAMPPSPPFPGVTPAGYADREPAWAPDGRRLALVRSQDDGPTDLLDPFPEQAIWVVEPDAGTSQQVKGSTNGLAPRWGRDGSLLFALPDRPPGEPLPYPFKPGTYGRLFWTSRPTRQPQVAVTRVDLPGWYYGQWYWSQMFDWWTPR